MLYEKWASISQKIDGIKAAGEFLINALKCNTQYGNNSQNEIVIQIRNSILEINSFKEINFKHLDIAARSSIESLYDFCHSQSLFQEDKDQFTEIQMVSFITRLLLTRNDVSYCLTDHQKKIKNLSEKAFLHLQRKIIVGADEKARWEKAFSKGEVECEKLGSLHLLWHGLWAFKINAEGERTDLIYSDERLSDIDANYEAVSGLVLTEWKVLRSGENATSKFSEACKQARMYTEGSLAGVELAKYRYAIVVSEENIHTPDDFIENDVVWRHINIAINSKTPSERSRKSPQINNIDDKSD